MNKTQEKMKEITDRLETGISELFESERYKEYLTTLSKLHSYSATNTLLIYLQKPDAQMVAGMTTWNQLHRYINKGEHGICILAPCPYKKYVDAAVLDENGNPKLDSDGKEILEKKKVIVDYYKPVYVYDISQTNGKPIETLQPVVLADSVSDYEKIMSALTEIAPCPVTFEKIESGANGYFSPGENRIAIKEGMPEALTVRCLIHEIGHSILHNLDADANGKDRQTKEVEAESVSFCVAQFLNIPTEEYSFPYIAGWSTGKKTEVLKQSLDTVRTCANQLINQLSEKMNLNLNLTESETKKQTRHI